MCRWRNRFGWKRIPATSRTGYHTNMVTESTRYCVSEYYPKLLRLTDVPLTPQAMLILLLFVHWRSSALRAATAICLLRRLHRLAHRRIDLLLRLLKKCRHKYFVHSLAAAYIHKWCRRARRKSAGGFGDSFAAMR